MYDYELIRFSTELNTQVVGGAGKIFKYFLRNYHPKRVLSYGNRRFVSKNNIYEKLGFKYVSTTKPNFYYYNGKKWNQKLIHRSKFQKFKLKINPEFKEIYSDFKTEEKMLFEKGYRKFYDAGHYKYEFVL